MKKWFIINIILHIFLVAVSAVYSFQIASGWNGLIILVTGTLAVLCVVVDIIGLITLAIVKHVRRKRQQNEEQLVEMTEKKKTLKIVLKVILLVILYGATALSVVTLGTTMVQDEATYHIFDARQPEKVRLTSNDKIIQDTYRVYKNAEFIYKGTDNQYAKQYTEPKDWQNVDIFHFRDTKTGLDFVVKRYIEHRYSTYYEVITDDFDYAYRTWVANELRSRVDMSLANHYIDDIQTNNNLDVDIYVSRYAYLDNKQEVEDSLTDIVSKVADILKEIDIYEKIEINTIDIKLLVSDEDGIYSPVKVYDWKTKQIKHW